RIVSVILPICVHLRNLRTRNLRLIHPAPKISHPVCGQSSFRLAFSPPTLQFRGGFRALVSSSMKLRVRKPEAVSWPTPQVPYPIGDELLNSGPQISQMNADKRSGRKTQEAITCRSWIHQDRRLGIMTDQASLNDGGSRVDHQCELPTILSLQALDGLSADR